MSEIKNEDLARQGLFSRRQAIEMDKAFTKAMFAARKAGLEHFVAGPAPFDANADFRPIRIYPEGNNFSGMGSPAMMCMEMAAREIIPTKVVSGS